MAMSFPSSDALASPQHQGNVNNNNSDSTSASSSNNNGIITPPTTSSNIPTTPMNDQPTGQNQSASTKRKPSRRANTAERRATHNAVERQRRETLNGRFLDLAGLLPNLSQIRRPSKSSIVNSSIAHIQASRRHRMIASRELRMLKTESDALRRELNEWRDRAGLPRVEDPVRGDGFGMVLAGELEVISGISIEEEDEDADDGFGLSLAVGGMPAMPHHAPQQHQQIASYGGPYMDDGDDDVTLLGPMYPQQQQGIHQPHHHHPMHHAPQHQMHHQQQQQHAMMAAAHDLEDPCVAAMLMKNAAAANPFAHTISASASSPTGYPTVNNRSTYGTNNNTSWVASPATYGPQTHLYTPPATSHGLPTPTVTAGTNSNSGSPVGGVSVNGRVNGSPVSTSSSISSLSGGGGGASPLPTATRGHMGNRTRERSGSGSLSTSGNSSGGQSPAYELHHAQVMQEYAGVSRMVGMGPSAPFVPSHHHHAHGMPVQQAIGAGGGVNGAMMMMMM